MKPDTSDNPQVPENTRKTQPTKQYGKVNPIDNERTSLEMELGRRSALNLGLESSIANLDQILRGTTSVATIR